MTLSYIPSDTNDEGILKATASGVLPNGKPVVVNADGTVSVVVGASGSQLLGSPSTYNGNETYEKVAVFDSNLNKVVIVYYDSDVYGVAAIVGTVSGTSISFGSEVAVSTSGTRSLSAVFDSNSNKVVVVYKDDDNSQYGTARVGTVSGTSISFGTPVVFESALTDELGATFDASNNKVVVAYRDRGNSNYGTGIVGTVSGTSISFGSPSVFQSSDSNSIKASFDTDSNKAVVVYRNSGDLGKGKAVVGTVSGTSISFGSPVVFNSSESRDPNLAFDSVNGKMVVAYRDMGNSSYGTAVVGTVSGTSISFGSSVVFESSQSVSFGTVYDINSQKIVISYIDEIDNGYIKFCSGAVSGTSISFDTPVTLDTTYGNFLSSVLDSNANKIVTVYTDSNVSNNGESVVFQVAYETTTLTASNYIGISTGGTYADGSNATVKIIGNTSDEQSGLTAGQSYYVQTDGTIGTTPADPSVFAGTAISATKMLVKT